MATTGIGNIAQDQFLQLLVAQLQNQNPLDPVSNQDMLSQLTQISTLDGINKLTATFEDMLQFQQLSEGNSLIGRTITYTKPSSSTLARGIVSGLSGSTPIKREARGRR